MMNLCTFQGCFPYACGPYGVPRAQRSDASLDKIYCICIGGANDGLLTDVDRTLEEVPTRWLSGFESGESQAIFDLSPKSLGCIYIRNRSFASASQT